MKSRTFFTIVTICFFMVGCKSKMAMNYNNMIVEKQKNLAKSMTEAEPKLKNYFNSFEYDSIVSVSGRMEAKIDAIIQEIKSKPAPKVKQGENFKQVAIGYFDYMKSIYMSYKNYGLQTTPEGRLFEKQIMSMVVSREDREIADMQEAQRIFAKNNGFKIKPAKEKQNGSLTAGFPGQ